MSLQSNRAPRAVGFVIGLGVGLVTLTFAAGAAQAHITLTNPKPWTTVPNGQKGAAPCGMTAAAKNPTTYRPGESIMVTWNETIKHRGRFRIAFAEEGQTFPNPMMMVDTNTTLPIFIDGIDPKTADAGATAHQRMITFPNKPCASCVLQLIQVMKVPPPYNAAADTDIYYQCAAIVLAGQPMGGGDGGPPDSGGGSTGGMGGGNTGGMGGSGGSTPTGGMSGGGTGGSMSTGGTTGTGGKPATGGTTGSTGGAGGEEEETGGTGGSRKAPGGCSIGGNSSGGLLAIAALALLIRRRRR